MLAELQAHRTAGLQAELAVQPDLVLLVLLHGLAMDAFYYRHGDTVARFTALPPALPVSPGLTDSPARQALLEIEQGWRTCLSQEPGDLWAWLREQDRATLLRLLAVCVARTADAGSQDWSTPADSQCLAAQVATAAGLDMRRSWTPTADSYFGRVPKALIVAAVQEGVGAGPGPANRLAGSKKEMMVADAAQLLKGTGWLPAML